MKLTLGHLWQENLLQVQERQQSGLPTKAIFTGRWCPCITSNIQLNIYFLWSTDLLGLQDRLVDNNELWADRWNSGFPISVFLKQWKERVLVALVMVIAKRYEVELECPKTGNPVLVSLPREQWFLKCRLIFQTCSPLPGWSHRPHRTPPWDSFCIYGILQSQTYPLPEHMREQLGKSWT